LTTIAYLDNKRQDIGDELSQVVDMLQGELDIVNTKIQGLQSQLVAVSGIAQFHRGWVHLNKQSLDAYEEELYNIVAAGLFEKLEVKKLGEEKSKQLESDLEDTKKDSALVLKNAKKLESDFENAKRDFALVLQNSSTNHGQEIERYQVQVNKALDLEKRLRKELENTIFYAKTAIAECSAASLPHLNPDLPAWKSIAAYMISASSLELSAPTAQTLPREVHISHSTCGRLLGLSAYYQRSHILMLVLHLYVSIGEDDPNPLVLFDLISEITKRIADCKDGSAPILLAMSYQMFVEKVKAPSDLGAMFALAFSLSMQYTSQVFQNLWNITEIDIDENSLAQYIQEAVSTLETFTGCCHNLKGIWPVH
jgi:hypothetical protein